MASVSLDLKTITIKAEEFVKVVKDNPGASAVTALGLAAGTWAFYRYRTYGVSPLTPVYQEDGVYPVEKKSTKVYFGKVKGQNRGEKPMDPPVVHDDPYYWMRDDKRKDSKVVRHLNRENAYFKHKTKELEPLREKIYKEFVSHVKETDEAVPYQYGDFFYYTRTVKGLSYKIHCRKPASGGQPGGAEQLIMDVNVLAKGKKHCDMQMLEPSPEHDIVAYTVDYTGYETYDVFFKDIKTGKLMPERIKECSGEVVWGANGSTIYYTTLDEEHRPNKVWRHTMGSPQSSDKLLLTEDDELFWIDLDKSCSGRFLIVRTSSPDTSEVHLLDLTAAGAEKADLKLVNKRVKDHRYKVEHWGDSLYIITNTGGCSNSKLVTVPISTSYSQDSWMDYMPYEQTTKLDYLVCFKVQRAQVVEFDPFASVGVPYDTRISFAQGHIVISGRCNGLKMCRVIDMGGGGGTHDLQFPDECFDMYALQNRVFDSDKFRFGYSSLISPNSTYDYHMPSRKRILLKQVEVPLYQASLYQCERTFATAKDGVKVPISVVYRKDSNWGKGKKASPCMLYGYGSYGICIDPSFDYKCVSFLDRGMVCAIAHIRGGGEMGREWYTKEGKYLAKRNTFTDFCDCAEHLIATGYTTAAQLACTGRSAGGLLMGVVANMRPDLFTAMVAGVPFVDLMVTMCDPSIPLTVTEWEEWGNPNEKEYFDYMMSYSPMDNIQEKPYPAIMVTAGLNDPRVAYWEPAKWVARIREKRTNKRTIVLKVDMSSGHFSASDRYKLMRESAIEYAFVMKELGCTRLLPEP